MSSKSESTTPSHTFIRQKELMKMLPFSPATLWRRIRANEFVRPTKLGPRITAWRKSDVLDWIDQQEEACK